MSALRALDFAAQEREQPWGKPLPRSDEPFADRAFQYGAGYRLGRGAVAESRRRKAMNACKPCGEEHIELRAVGEAARTDVRGTDVRQISIRREHVGGVSEAP